MALENLSPIVREEQLLAGEDLEPTTRLEYFLKQAGSGGSGSVPVPSPTAADTGKVLTANNGAVEWHKNIFDFCIYGVDNTTFTLLYGSFSDALNALQNGSIPYIGIVCCYDGETHVLGAEVVLNMMIDGSDIAIQLKYLANGAMLIWSADNSVVLD